MHAEYKNEVEVTKILPCDKSHSMSCMLISIDQDGNFIERCKQLQSMQWSLSSTKKFGTDIKLLLKWVGGELPCLVGEVTLAGFWRSTTYRCRLPLKIGGVDTASYITCDYFEVYGTIKPKHQERIAVLVDAIIGFLEAEFAGKLNEKTLKDALGEETYNKHFKIEQK